MLGIDKRAVAERIRGLLVGGQPAIRDWTQRLGVSPLALQMSVDEEDPFPTFDVLSALVREQGVDPVWLLTGQYDTGPGQEPVSRPEETHRLITRLLADRLTPRNPARRDL